MVECYIFYISTAYLPHIHISPFIRDNQKGLSLSQTSSRCENSYIKFFHFVVNCDSVSALACAGRADTTVSYLPKPRKSDAGYVEKEKEKKHVTLRLP